MMLPPLQDNMRKVSSAGRFKIFTKTENDTTRSRAETAPPEASSPLMEEPPSLLQDAGGKFVHFSVDEKGDDEHYDTIGSMNMDSTLMNAKSWR